MPILRPYLTPTAGTPSPVRLSGAAMRRSNMANEQFYDPNNRALQQQEGEQEEDPVAGFNQEFQNPSMTGTYLKDQLAKYANRPAPPQLDPGARVIKADSSKVAPDTFKSFYDSLASIKAIGDEMTAAESARAAYQKLQNMSSLGGSSSSGGSSGGKKSNVGNAYGGNIPSNPQANFKYAQNIAPQFGWSGKELNAWYTLGMKESGWRNTAQNPTSTAYGIGQFLNSTWKGVGIAKTSNPELQVLAMAKYIKQRYGSPSAALAFHYKNNWY